MKLIDPKIVIDRSTFPNANDEYTPAQRRLIDARLAESDDDLKQGARTVLLIPPTK